jgi:diguanylate cyclase (GGDEF)-like protein
VARYGGDGFVILMGGIGAEEAKRMAERIQAAVERYDVGLHHETLGDLRLGISIGFACFPQDGWDWDTLFSMADTRMYHNKTERKLRRLVGRNVDDSHDKLPQAVPTRAIERSA